VSPADLAPTSREVMLGVAAFAVAVLFGAPGLTWHDGGELALAAATAGVAHAPGEPAWLTLAAVAARLPIGELPFRLTIFSAATVGACAALLAGVVRRESTAAAGLMAGALFGASSGLQLQGVRPELYAFAAVLGLLAVAAAQLGGRRGLALAVLPCCVAGAVHPAMLVAAVPGLAVLATRSGARAWGVAVVAAAALLVPGLGQLAWLPLRSLADPALDVGSPRTLERVLFMASAQGYARSFELIDGQLMRNLIDHGRMAIQELGPVSCLLAAAAAVLHRDRRATLAGLFFVGFGILPSALQSAFQWHNPDLRGYLLGPLAVLCAGAGVGAVRALQLLAARAPGATRPVAVALALATVGLAFTGTAERARLKDLESPRRLGTALLDAAPPGALLLPQGDTWVYPALYQRWWEGRRPDTQVVMLHGLGLAELDFHGARHGIDAAAVRAALAPHLPLPAGVQPEWILRALPSATDRPILVTDGFLPPEMLARRQPVGPWLRLDGPGAPQAEERYWAETLQPLSTGPGWAADRVARVALSRRFGARGGLHLARGDGPTAARLFERGGLLVGDPSSMIQLMRFRHEQGQDTPGSGGLPSGPWAASFDRWDDAGGRALLVARPNCLDCGPLAAAAATMQGDFATAAADLRPVFGVRPTHPTALIVAERLYTLGFEAGAP